MNQDQKQAKRNYDRNRYIKRREQELANRPPDIIEKLTPEELAYIAGIIDGEGSIYVAAVGPDRFRSVYPMVVVGMTHRGVIEWLKEKWGSGTIKLNNHTSLRLHTHYKPQYRVILFGKRAKLLCRVILPYLKVKCEQAKLVCEFPTDARIGPGIKIERSKVNEVRYKLRDMVNALNH